MPLPIVVIQIDANSRLSVLQEKGVRVAVIDRRIDPHLALLPERDQPREIDAAIVDLAMVAPGLKSDDLARTAGEMLRRLIEHEIVVAGVLR